MSHFEASNSNPINGKAFVSFVLGLVSIMCVIIVPIGIIIGVIGFIIGYKGVKETNRAEKSRKIAVGGIICSSIGAMLPILLMILSSLNK